MEDYGTTFGRVFGEQSPRGMRCSSPRDDIRPQAPWSQENNVRGGSQSPTREDFGVGFIRAKSACSPPPRTRCVQDIILRDRTGAMADMPPPVRNNPTTAVTATTHQDLQRRRRASPSGVRELLGITGLARAADIEREEHIGGKLRPRADGSAMANRTISPRSPRGGGSRAPPGGGSQDVSTIGALTFKGPPLQASRDVSPPAGSTSPRQSRSSAKRLFSPRNVTGKIEEGLDDGRTEARFYEELQGGRAGAKLSQCPKASLELGKVPAPGHLALRADGYFRITDSETEALSELQFRTREIAKIRSRQHVQSRWK